MIAVSLWTNTAHTATQAVKKKAQPETYSAFDPEFEGPPEVAEERLPPAPPAAVPAQKVAQTASPAGPRDRFDTVPSAQAEGIVKRLKLVEELIEKHGRAYDYRLLTVKELEAILAKLEQESAKGE